MIRLLGIPFRIHPLFWLLVAICFLTGYIWNVLIVFVIVCIHELGHTFAAKWVGWDIEEVLLFPFGGVLKVYNQGTEPLKDVFIVTIAGPLQHLLIPLLSWLLLYTPFWTPSLHQLAMMYNFTILIFNLLPVWPLDGAKLVSIVLMHVLPFNRAAAATDILSAAFLFALSIYLNYKAFNPESLCLLTFLAFMGWAEWRNREMQFVRFLLFRWRRTFWDSRTKLLQVSTHDTFAQITKKFYRQCHHAIYVKETGKRLSEEQVLEYYFKEGFIHKPLSVILESQP